MLRVESVEHGVGGFRYRWEEGVLRCCCHSAMLSGRRWRAAGVVHRGRSRSYEHMIGGRGAGMVGACLTFCKCATYGERVAAGPGVRRGAKEYEEHAGHC
ncbi:LOW QUALITY PROTEIN: conserved hypothetical protein, partial [Streptomyces sp. SPB78]